MPQASPVPTTDHLNANLAALRVAQARLFERVCWPVEGDHLFEDEAARWTYQFRGACLPFELDARDVANSLSEFRQSQRAGAATEVFIFGLGLGEQLRALLDEFPTCTVSAWDRDPWVLRQVLRLHDWTSELKAGRVRFALGVDLIDYAQAARGAEIVWHPLLAGVYANEKHLIESGLGTKRALMCAGGLFVDSVADALREEGYGVYTLDVERLAVEEIEYACAFARADVLCSINYVQGLADYCEAQELDYLCWEIDPATDAPESPRSAATRTRLFTYRAANVAVYERAGFPNVQYTPLAADPNRRKPMELTADERATFGSDVSFVGASLMKNVAAYQQSFVARVQSWKPQSRDFGQEILSDIVREQRADFSKYVVPELLEAHLPGLRADCLAQGLEDPAMLVAEVCAAEKRFNYVAELSQHDVAVWGDEGWAQLRAHGISYRGPARHEHDVPRIYSAARIHLDVGRIYQNDIVPMRIFDILACGGFVLAEHSPALAELFQVGVEVESYRTLAELKHKVAHFLAHPAEASAIAAAGRAAVLSRHHIQGRVRDMLASFAASR